jgi:hypothetical protein
MEKRSVKLLFEGLIVRPKHLDLDESPHISFHPSLPLLSVRFEEDSRVIDLLTGAVRHWKHPR